MESAWHCRHGLCPLITDSAQPVYWSVFLVFVLRISTWFCNFFVFVFFLYLVFKSVIFDFLAPYQWSIPDKEFQIIPGPIPWKCSWPCEFLNGKGAAQKRKNSRGRRKNTSYFLLGSSQVRKLCLVQTANTCCDLVPSAALAGHKVLPLSAVGHHLICLMGLDCCDPCVVQRGVIRGRLVPHSHQISPPIPGTSAPSWWAPCKWDGRTPRPHLGDLLPLLLLGPRHLWGSPKQSLDRNSPTKM